MDEDSGEQNSGLRANKAMARCSPERIELEAESNKKLSNRANLYFDEGAALAITRAVATSPGLFASTTGQKSGPSPIVLTSEQKREMHFD